MMVSVLLRLKSSGILDEYPNLAAYLARGEARPAYKRAFAAQLAVNAAGRRPADEICPRSPPRHPSLARCHDSGGWLVQDIDIAASVCGCRPTDVRCITITITIAVGWLAQMGSETCVREGGHDDRLESRPPPPSPSTRTCGFLYLAGSRRRLPKEDISRTPVAAVVGASSAAA